MVPLKAQAGGLAVVVLAAACGAPEAPSATASSLTLAVKADVSGFFPNPPTATETYTLQVNRNIVEGLVRFDSLMKLEPAIAERWENPDDRTYVFTLRPGLRFSNGRPLTAADVAASLQAARERHWLNRVYLHAVESVRALDALRVEIRTRAPYMILLSKLPFGFVLPADVLDQQPVPTIGSGPYCIESWQPGREIRLVRNPYFRGPRPAFDRARFAVVPDGATRVAMVRRGEADLADHVPLEALPALASAPDVQVVSRKTLRVLFLGLRVDRPPFSDPRVREAVDVAIDRGELVRRALSGYGEPVSQLVPPAVVGHNPRIPLTRTDRPRARRLLAAAGHAGGLRLRLDGPLNRYTNDLAILHEVARQLGEVGIQLEVNAVDKVEFYSLLNGGRARFYLLGWACESGDAGEALDSLAHTPDDGLLGHFNLTGFSDAELDRLIDEANHSPTVRERTLTLQVALARVAALRPLIPLVVQTEAVLLSRRIRWDPPVNLAFDLSEMRPAR